MSSGRSPYPTRSRARRLQQQTSSQLPTPSSQASPHSMHNNMDESSSSFGSSSFMLGQGLVQARISPANQNHHSTSGGAAKHPRRFFGTAMKPPRSHSPPAKVVRSTAQEDHHRDRNHRDHLVDGMNLTQLRALTKASMGTIPGKTSSPSMAVFYASIVYAKTQATEDAFVYAKTLSQNHEAKRCVKLLERSALFSHPTLGLESVLLAAQALASLGEWTLCMLLLEDSAHYAPHQQHHQHPTVIEDDDDIAWQALKETIPSSSDYIHPLSRLCCLRGQAYAETGHPLRAARFWKLSLQLDPLCVQALDWMLERSVVAPDQALQTLLHLEFPPHMEWLRALYLARVQVAGTPHDEEGVPTMTTSTTTIPAEEPFWQDESSIQILSPSFQQQAPSSTTAAELSCEKLFFGEPHHDPPDLQEQPQPEEQEDALDTLWNTHKLHKSSEVLALAAKRAYRAYDLQHALQYCQELANVDPLCQTAGFVYVSTLVALQQKRLLFQLAHEWVDAAPKSARAWFAVGAYYYTCGRYHVAQRHFCRATRLDPHCSEAWIAFGTSFAACDESDQALASFRAAQRLAPGDHTSLLYIGMEYLRTNHLVLAQHFLHAAQKSSNDPLCYNELGVLCMAQKNYKAAIDWFCKALQTNTTNISTTTNTTATTKTNQYETNLDDLLDTTMDVYWEPTVFNLGQAFRKTRAFENAAKCLERCLTLRESASAYAALGFCKHLQGDYDGAIDTYHRSLSRQPENPFCTELLQRALTDALEQGMGIMGNPIMEPLSHPTHPHDTPKKEQPQSNPNTSIWTEDGRSISVDESSTTSDVDMG